MQWWAPTRFGDFSPSDIVFTRYNTDIWFWEPVQSPFFSLAELHRAAQLLRILQKPVPPRSHTKRLRRLTPKVLNAKSSVLRSRGSRYLESMDLGVKAPIVPLLLRCLPKAGLGLTLALFGTFDLYLRTSQRLLS